MSGAVGLISEAEGHNGTGLHVITAWDSKADHERFVGERLFAAFRAGGVDPGPMRFTDLDVEAMYLRTEQPVDS